MIIELSMYHVFELFKNLKTKKIRHEDNCEKITTSKLIPYCLFSNLILNTI
jgi:hypothetical protein